MAKPAFIYAFDNLGPERFAELCGLLMASRYKGFLLGGVGADGGVDAELDEALGEWQPESVSPLLNEVIQPGRLVVFQFKHKVTARVGQARARGQLLNLYRCQVGKKCELHRDLILQKHPNTYVLVTNIEVNSEYRAAFVEQCRLENLEIEHYQVIGLDELEAWVTMEMELRHLYFPAIFGPPRFCLQVRLDSAVMGHPAQLDKTINVLIVSVLNVGLVPSYIRLVIFKIIVDGQVMSFQTFDFKNEIMEALNPKSGAVVEPGRKLAYYYPLEVLRTMKEEGKDVLPVEVIVSDEIGNEYRAAVPENIRRAIVE